MNYNNSKKVIFLPVILGIACSYRCHDRTISSRQIMKSAQHSNIRSRNDKLNSILNIIESNYVDSVNRNDLVETAIPAILKKLDPHSVYHSGKRSCPGK